MQWKSDLSEGKTLCLACEMLHDVSQTTCERCGATLHQRKPHSLPLSWAYAMAALLFLIPANVLPMMNVISMGVEDRSTILEGVIYFLKHGEYGLAAVIFIASVAVPFFKLATLIFLLLIVHFQLSQNARVGLTMVKIIHFIGKWSMLDIFVVALMVSMVQFQALATIETGLAAFAFCAAVVLTIMAVEKFDPRLMWDITDSKKEM
jgi:paraquat-inducible protein A